jgi:hypothetical protein
MKWLTVEYIKKHSRLDGCDEDEIIELKGKSAEKTILNMIDRTYEEVVALYGKEDELVPAPLVELALMMVDDSLHNRSMSSDRQIYDNPAFAIRIKPYMKLADVVETPFDIPIGSQMKIAFSVSLSDDLHMEDVDFTVKVLSKARSKSVTMDKAECIQLGSDGYVAMVDSNDLGVGGVAVRVEVRIPDNDFAAGYRTEIYNIPTEINITL